jgi:hypothetical protein
MEPSSEKVKLEIWLSASDENSYKFLNDLSTNFQKVKEFIDFKPLYALWYCTYCKYKHYNVDNPNCLSGGRYCYPDPGMPNLILEFLNKIKGLN